MKTVTKKIKKPVGLTKKQRLSHLNSAIDLCFAMLEEQTTDLKEIANLTQLSITTLRRMARGEISLGMEVNTLDKLATAAGMKIEIGKTDIKLSLLS